jgi:hypothetical protein
VDNPKGVGLRRPAEIVDRLRPIALPGGVEFVNRYDLARLRLGEEVVLLVTPPRGGVAAESLPGIGRIGAGPRLHVDKKGVNRRGAGPMDAKRGAGEGYGVHICTGPVNVRGYDRFIVVVIRASHKLCPTAVSGAMQITHYHRAPVVSAACDKKYRNMFGAHHIVKIARVLAGGPP